MELLDHIVVLFLIFWETFILFSTEAVPIYIPTNSVLRFLFLHILVDICYWQMLTAGFFTIEPPGEPVGNIVDIIGDIGL